MKNNPSKTINQKLNDIENKVMANTKTIGKFKTRFDAFLNNHFNEVKNDVKWLKKIQWYQLGIIASIFVSIAIALIVKALG